MKSITLFILSLGIILTTIACAGMVASQEPQSQEGVVAPQKKPPTPTPTIVIPTMIPSPTVVPTPWPMPTATVTSVPPVSLLIQYRGGTNPCRYLYRSQRLGTFSGVPMVAQIIAAMPEVERTSLTETNEAHLIGPNGPHTFTVVGSTGDIIVDVPVPYGETVLAHIEFPKPGVYEVFDRQNPGLGKIAEIYARPVGQPGGAGGNQDWCTREESAPPLP